MGWDDTVRQKKLAPIGEYSPKVYRVTVHDTFRQIELEMAALGIQNGMSVSEFLGGRSRDRYPDTSSPWSTSPPAS